MRKETTSYEEIDNQKMDRYTLVQLLGGNMSYVHVPLDCDALLPLTLDKETTMKQRILALLMAYHQGKDQAITVEQIADALRLHDIGATGLPVRKAVKELIQKDFIPIGSCTRGYYIIKTEKERLQTIDNLIARQNSIRSRIRALRGCTL